MEQPFGKFLMFSNRLQKVFRHRSKQARNEGISCYRVYDHDLPEFPLVVEIYEDNICLAEYRRRHRMDEEEHEAWMKETRKVISTITSIPEEKIFSRTRQRKGSRADQYVPQDDKVHEIIGREGGLKFIVNLSDYLDTGLFLDHRITRAMVRERVRGKRVLNLFAYTGSFSVYAAAGGASEIVTVDLSKTYLAWAERNMDLNFPEFKANHQLIHADVKVFLQNAGSKYDLIVMDPPTFSNSKRMDDILDIQRDHAGLINQCLALLNEGGELFFSTNFTKFQLEANKIDSSNIKDITARTTPFDFAGKLKRPCYLISK